MFRSLYSKLAIALLGLFCLLGISFVTLTLFTLDMYQQEIIQRLNKNLAKQIVAQKILMKDHKINEKGLKEIFNMLMMVNPSIEVYLLNRAGEILAYSAPPGKVKVDKVDLEPIKKWFEAGTVYPLMGDNPRNPERKKVFTGGQSSGNDTLKLTYSQIIQMPSIEKNVLLICPGVFAYHAHWKGISVVKLLEMARLSSGVTHVTFSGPEGTYEKTERFSIEDILSNRVFLAYGVNDKVLPKKHGFSLRVVAEKYYGSDWIKYVYKVTVDRP